MQFILTFTIPPATRDAAIARFLETGARPPPGVNLLGRWTRLDLRGGFVWVESEDPQALTAFAHAWSDVVEVTLAPVLADQDLVNVLERAGRPPASAEAYPEDSPVAPETTPGTAKPPYEEIA